MLNLPLPWQHSIYMYIHYCNGGGNNLVATRESKAQYTEVLSPLTVCYKLVTSIHMQYPLCDAWLLKVHECYIAKCTTVMEILFNSSKLIKKLLPSP